MEDVHIIMISITLVASVVNVILSIRARDWNASMDGLRLFLGG